MFNYGIVPGVKARRLIQALWDALGWLLAPALAVEFRYDFHAVHSYVRFALVMGFVFAVAQIVLGYIFQIYRGRYRIGSVDEVLGLVGVVAALSLAGLGFLLVVFPEGIPRSTPVLAGGLALVWMLAGRLVLRFTRGRVSSRHPGARALIYGAGEAGDQILRLMIADRSHTFRPVGFIDDDLAKQRLRSRGLRVLGTSSNLSVVAIDRRVEVLVVAIVGISSQRLKALTEECSKLGIGIRVVPTATSLMDGVVALDDIAEVTIEDLLGRQPIGANEAAISGFLQGKRVLITGAGGSIGSELARQVFQYEPESLVLLDRDESALQATELSLDGKGLLDSERLVLADIRDAQRLREVLEARKPEIVFHAAALKHLSLLQAYPAEAVKTNVIGTQNLLTSALEVGVQAFVNISTDKAANPTSVLGYSKLITERLTAAADESATGRYLSVRFGNVLGSRGSVLNTFRDQIKNGGPVTVTHPDVTRFFMTVEEAVHLVLQAAAEGQGGRTLILNMGEPVRIAAVAQQLIEASGSEIEVAFVGLRAGEKLHEELVGDRELVESTTHPLVSQTSVNRLAATAELFVGFENENCELWLEELANS